LGAEDPRYYDKVAVEPGAQPKARELSPYREVKGGRE